MSHNRVISKSFAHSVYPAYTASLCQNPRMMLQVFDSSSPIASDLPASCTGAGYIEGSLRPRLEVVFLVSMNTNIMIPIIENQMEKDMKWNMGFYPF